MSEPHRVILLGFTAFERSALGSYFRLAMQRQPNYLLVDELDEAQFLVADADAPGVLAQVLGSGRVADTVFVGGHSPPGAAAWMMRPIDPLHVMREFDSMVVRGGAPGVTASLPLAHAGAAASAPRRRQDDAAHTQPGPPRPAPSPPPPPPAPGVLLVDDSDIALRFLEKQLQRFRLQPQRAANSARALELLASQPFAFVFLDVELGERSALDGLALCQHIKRRHVDPAGRAPVVVLVSAHHGPEDQVRGALAGCDAYLGKPLDAAALGELLQRHGVQPAAATSAAR